MAFPFVSAKSYDNCNFNRFVRDRLNEIPVRATGKTGTPASYEYRTAPLFSKFGNTNP